MTHLPEVEVTRKELEREVVGKRIKEVTVKTASLLTRHRNRPEFYKALTGRKIEGISRRATWLVFELDDGSALAIRPGTQASLSRETATEEVGRHTQFVATFTTGGSLHYVDQAKDGELFVAPQAELETMEELSPTGIDPLADQFTWHSVSRELTSRQAKLKPLLTDPSFVVGLGDLYADEILWAAGLSGHRVSSTLSAQEVRRLYRAILEVLYEAVKQGGAGDVPFDPDEEHGEVDYGDFVKVYGREGQPCARCRQPIQLATVDGASLYYCPQCQT